METELILGTSGSDRLEGSSDSDRIVALQGNDNLLGFEGSDLLVGGRGRDTLNGGSDDDFLAGGFGDDVLVGGAGDDTIYGEQGADTITGGDGSDIIVISPITGGSTVADADVITDFVRGQDIIELQGGRRFEDISIESTAPGDAVVRDRATGQFLLVLQGIDSNILDSSDFRSILGERTPEPDPIPITSGTTLETAANVSIASTNITYTSQVGGTNPNAFFEFSLGATNEFNLSLDNLSADVNVEIIDQETGDVALSSTNTGIVDESISGMLGTGAYAIRVFSTDDAITDYDLDLSVAPQLSGITTTASDVPIQTTTDVSGPLINIGDFRPDPRFTGVDGSGFATVILDTGINLDHPFFGPDTDSDGVADRIVYHQDFADNDLDASDVDGHGSNVSSIVASSDPIFTGIAPGADIIHLKVFSDNGEGDFSFIQQALQWVIENVDTYNIASVNMSLGDEQNWTTATSPYVIGDELEALATEDVIVVSASGNDFFGFNTIGVSYPSADPNSLSIGAVYDSNVGGRSYASGAEDFTTEADRIISFSQRHPILTTVFAPGGRITGAAHDDNGIFTTQGTSQAAPHVAGMAVLAQQLAVQELGRRLTPTEFTELLVSTGVTINDGDDEDDNVTNTGLDFRRADMFALAEAILELAPTPVNQPPIAEDDDFTITAGTATTFGVIDDDSDPDGDPISLLGVSMPNNGTASLATDNQVLYEPNAGFIGTDTFTYSISDGNGGIATASVSVTVTPPENQSPIAEDDSQTTLRDQPVNINVLVNDSDPDGDPILIDGFATTSQFGGSVVLFDDSLQYTPADGFTGEDSFLYTISDGNGGNATASVTVTVTPPENQPPVAEDDNQTTIQDQPANINVLVNDSDPDGDPLTIGNFETITAEGGTVSQIGNSLQYTPADGFTGNDTFLYTISDGNGGNATASVTVTVTPLENQLPVAGNDLATTFENTPVNINVLGNDFDADGDPLTIGDFGTSTAAGGTVSQIGNSLQYTPADGFTGEDSFFYIISDGNGGTDTATVTVTVEDSGSLELGGIIGETYEDLNENGIRDLGEPGLAAVTVFADLNNNGVLDPDEPNAVTSDTGGYFFPDLEPNTYQLRAIVLSGFILTTAEVQVVTVDPGAIVDNIDFGFSQTSTPDNQPPTASNDFISIPEVTAVSIDVLANDFDTDGDSVSITNFEGISDNGGTIERDNNGTPLNLSDDSLVYTPAAGFSGTDSFTYTISDGNGGFDNAAVTVTVAGTENDPPIALDDFPTTLEDTPVIIDVLANDSDADFDPISAIEFDSTSINGGTNDNSQQDPGETNTGFETFSSPESALFTLSDFLNAGTFFIGILANDSQVINYSLSLSSEQVSLTIQDPLTGTSTSDVLVGTFDEESRTQSLETEDSLTLELSDLLSDSPQELTMLGTSGVPINANLSGLIGSSADGFDLANDGNLNMGVDETANLMGVII